MDKHKIQKIIILCILFFVAACIRMASINAPYPGMLGDEITIAKTSTAILKQPEFVPFSEENLGHSTLLLYINGAFMQIFGHSLFALRLSSILLGALTVSIFYLLCLFFFDVQVSVTMSFLLAFSYGHIIVSRFANEISAALFFQVLVWWLSLLAIKKLRAVYFVLIGIASGLGLMTYISFRTIAIVSLMLISIYIIKKRLKIEYLGLLIIGLLLTIYPLVSFSLNHPRAIWARIQSVSVFNQDLPASEVIKEIAASSLNELKLFAGPGDPDPRPNPARTAMYDPIIMILFAVGLVILIRKARNLAFLVGLLAIPPIINDIFTIEIIPDFRIYGQAHPNTFHVAGLIPIMLFVSGWALLWLKPRLDKFFPAAFFVLSTLLVSLSGLLNLYHYFGQTPESFVYIQNGTKQLKIVELINSSSQTKIYLTSNLLADSRVQFFSKNTKKLLLFDKAADGLTIIDPLDNATLAAQLVQSPKPNQGYLFNPLQQIEAIYY